MGGLDFDLLKEASVDFLEEITKPIEDLGYHLGGGPSGDRSAIKMSIFDKNNLGFPDYVVSQIEETLGQTRFYEGYEIPIVIEYHNNMPEFQEE